jgi:hypothetical protein
MNSIISFVLHPILPVNVGEDDEPAGIDVVYPLTIFFAFGIWLVCDRYYRMHNSPVPFNFRVPEVRSNLISDSTLLDIKFISRLLTQNGMIQSQSESLTSNPTSKTQT